MKKSLSILLISCTAVLASCSRSEVGGSSFFSSLSSSGSSSEQSEKSNQPASLSPGRSQTVEEPADKPQRRVAGGKSVIGGIAESPISKSLSDTDRRVASEAEFRALEFGKPGIAAPWRNPSNGRYGNVVASKPFRQKNIFCRQYTHTIYLNGRPEITNGIACRNKDGSWQNLSKS